MYSLKFNRVPYYGSIVSDILSKTKQIDDHLTPGCLSVASSNALAANVRTDVAVTSPLTVNGASTLNSNDIEYLHFISFSLHKNMYKLLTIGPETDSGEYSREWPRSQSLTGVGLSRAWARSGGPEGLLTVDSNGSRMATELVAIGIIYNHYI